MTAKAAYKGLVAGAAGVAAMTLAEKIEQTFTRRPNSYVPAHTLERLLRQPHRPDDQRVGMNWVMHWGQGILLGAVRGWMAEGGVRGPIGSFLHLNLRLLNDQSIENATGVGAPPWTWPVDEQWIDLMGKGVYAIVTGMVADAWIEAPRESRNRKSPGHCANLLLHRLHPDGGLESEGSVLLLLALRLYWFKLRRHGNTVRFASRPIASGVMSDKNIALRRHQRKSESASCRVNRPG